VARAERVIVAVKIAFLVLLVAVGVAGVSTERLAPAQWSSPVSVIAGGMITFLAYEGPHQGAEPSALPAPARRQRSEVLSRTPGGQRN
jgi:amino acid transporter